MHLDVHFAKFVECFIMMLHCTCLLVGTLFECYINCISVEYDKHEWKMGTPIVIRFEDLISTFGNNLFEFCFHWTTILFGLQYTFTGSKF